MTDPAVKTSLHEPRWPAFIAICATALIYGAMPQYLAISPRWLLIVIVIVLEVPALFTFHRGYHKASQILGYIISGVMTAFELWSLALLVMYLPQHKETSVQILRSAGILWVSNVIVFSLWYWRLDAGGPAMRDRRGGHVEGAFLFPQMTMSRTRENWSPRFIDYLFLSFNTSTALSPTDAPILSRWAKALVMLQAMISLTIIVLLAARAVNIM